MKYKNLKITQSIISLNNQSITKTGNAWARKISSKLVKTKYTVCELSKIKFIFFILLII